ncbi:MAG: hypothetical protein ACI9W2_003238 [Gammaproteobacteria bacterium]|jgi:hypothetical protein
MAYTLDEFCADCRAAITADNGPDGREVIRGKLEQLLANQDFVRTTLGPAAELGVHTLYKDEDFEFVVLAHINETPASSPPHDHGNSWAIYGQATEYTDMSEYRRLDGGEGDGEAKLEQVKAYRLTPGKAGLYDVRVIHAINYPANARFVRVTGRELELEPRLKFDLSANKASFIESQGVQ